MSAADEGSRNAFEGIDFTLDFLRGESADGAAGSVTLSISGNGNGVDC